MKFKYRVLLLWLIFCVFLFGGIKPAYAQHKVLSSLEEEITSLVESIKPSLVTIETESQFLAGEKKENIHPTFVGSGIIYTSDGYILTTASVVGERQSFKVTLSNQKSLKGKLVGTDEQSNLAVLKVDATGLTPAKLGDSDKVKVGSWLTVVGNSYGLPNAVALGLVNGLREDGFIQMSANVSPGNSGGPVLDTYGKVIGLVSAKLSEPSVIGAIEIYEKALNRAITIPSREIEIPSSGVSLALPVNKIKKVADQIIKYGSVERGYLGIYPEDLNPTLAQKYDLTAGVLVSQVVKGSPADQAGLLNGDLVIDFGGTEVKNSNHIRQLIESRRAGESVELKIIREGEKNKLTAILGKAKPAYQYSWRGEFKAPAPNFGSPMIPVEMQSLPNVNRFEQVLSEPNEESISQLREEIMRLEENINKLSDEIEKLKQERLK